MPGEIKKRAETKLEIRQALEDIREVEIASFEAKIKERKSKLLKVEKLREKI